MNGTKAVLDSNVLIFLSKRLVDGEKLKSKYEEFFVSIITYMEVYAYDFPDDTQKAVLDEIFDNLTIIAITKEIADQAIAYRKSKTKKIKLPDAIILASAKFVNADLLTDDWRDFRDIDSMVFVKDIEELRPPMAES